MKPILLTLLASFSLAFAESPWIPLFNGKDLSGWTPKICKHPLGENFANTYRVEDGILKVSYDAYAKFDKQYGHLYTNLAYSHYLIPHAEPDVLLVTLLSFAGLPQRAVTRAAS